MANTYDGIMPSTIQLLMDYTLPTAFGNSDPEIHFNDQGIWDPWAASTVGPSVGGMYLIFQPGP